MQPVYGAWSFVCSYFQLTPPFTEIEGVTNIWRGISIGVYLSAKLIPKTGLGVKTGWKIKPDIANIFKDFGLHRFKNLGVGFSVTNYGLVYGNGGDFIPTSGKMPKRDIGDGHFPGINQDHDK